jgi:DNA-binding MarR family transcriptional regulator|tara:strand:+ start:268 stop:477 length:210 start_codon:yes stop_codon:yes gene_type:complete
METLGIISRCRNKEDERSVEIHLTQSARKLSNKAKDIPAKMFNITGFTPEQLQSLNLQLDQLLVNISEC